MAVIRNWSWKGFKVGFGCHSWDAKIQSSLLHDALTRKLDHECFMFSNGRSINVKSPTRGNTRTACFFFYTLCCSAEQRISLKSPPTHHGLSIRLSRSLGRSKILICLSILRGHRYKITTIDCLFFFPLISLTKSICHTMFVAPQINPFSNLSLSLSLYVRLKIHSIFILPHNEFRHFRCNLDFLFLEALQCPVCIFPESISNGWIFLITFKSFNIVGYDLHFKRW